MFSGVSGAASAPFTTMLGSSPIPLVAAKHWPAIPSFTFAPPSCLFSRFSSSSFPSCFPSSSLLSMGCRGGNSPRGSKIIIASSNSRASISRLVAKGQPMTDDEGRASAAVSSVVSSEDTSANGWKTPATEGAATMAPSSAHEA